MDLVWALPYLIGFLYLQIGLAATGGVGIATSDSACRCSRAANGDDTHSY